MGFFKKKGKTQKKKKKKKKLKSEEEKIIIKLLKVGQWIDSLTKHIAQYNTISNILLFIIIIFPH